MSEKDIIKDYFIKEYRQNGGTDDLSEEDIKTIITKLDAQKEIFKLRKELEKKNSAPPPEKPKFNGIASGLDAGRENAALAREFAEIFGAYQDYISPPFDERVIEDPSYKRDNAMVVADQGVILRDREGRADAGGPSKYTRGVPEW